MAIKEGVILSVKHYIDTSFNDRVPSVQLVIKTHNKLVDTFKYDYYGEKLQRGDIVQFEEQGFFDFGSGLKSLVKKG